MKLKCTFFTLLMASAATVFGQTRIQDSGQLFIVEASDASGDWISLPVNNITPDALYGQYKTQFGLGDHDDMTLVKSETDQLGWAHYRYQQEHNGVPVEFAVYNVHVRDGSVEKANGKLATSIHIVTEPTLDRDQALNKAIEFVGADLYYWQIPEMNERKQNATGDPDATFYPEGQLLIVDRDFDLENLASYRLAWKFDIHTYAPDGRYWVYVDAHNGTIIKELDIAMHENGYPGVAVTRYSGVQEIIADSTENGFVLRDYTRGKGVETFDAVDSLEVDYAVDFLDDDNYWDNANDRADDAATDAHWATEQLYDYLRDRHGFDSYDNQGSKLICYVHVGQNWFNASWSGFWSRYGDAGGEPWTNVDVVGHEFAHGFTWATSQLVYSREPGALNESFSDILGEALQRYVSGGVVDWIATPSPVDTIRSYSNPNDYESPDTYLGGFWETESGDNYGVHTNSGVQNHWFYLLSEGGVGVNDNGDDYEVESIGFENAIDIVFRNMIVYLTPMSDYSDARQGSLNAAEDLFGSCSFEYRQVANAWHAVGVGERAGDSDFTAVDVTRFDPCNISPSEEVTVTIKYLGCDSSGPVSLVVTLLKSNPPLTFVDTVNIPEGVGPGEAFEHTFSAPFDFSRTGEHSLSARVTTHADLNLGNNTSDPYITHNLAPVSLQHFKFHMDLAPRTYRDSMAFQVGHFADLDVMRHIGRDSTFGIRIEGDRMRYANPVNPGQDLFDMNPRIGASICLCMDATEMDSMALQFDLRQTYSSDFERTVGYEQPPTSALRLLIEDEEIARYFPETNNEDEWRTHTVDLEEYLGEEFHLCFETRTVQSLAEDADTIGDRVLLDNIRFIGKKVQTSVGYLPGANSIEVFPNPAGEYLNVTIAASIDETAEFHIYDLDGRFVKNAQGQMAGAPAIQIDIGSLSAGMYFIETRVDGERYIGRFVRM